MRPFQRRSGGLVNGEAEVLELFEDLGFVGGALGGMEMGSAGEAEECPGGVVAILLILAMKLALDVVEGLEEQNAETVGGDGGDFRSLLVERGLEGGMVVLPAINGGAVEVEDSGDGRVGLAGDQEGDGGQLAVGEDAIGDFGLRILDLRGRGTGRCSDAIGCILMHFWRNGQDGVGSGKRAAGSGIGRGGDFG